MNKQEILEAIGSTIVANGQKGITAESLANILVEMVNASGEGSGNVTVFVGDIDQSTGVATQTEVEKAHNAEVFLTIKNAVVFPTVNVDMSKSYSASMGVVGVKYVLINDAIAYMPQEVAEAVGAPSEMIGIMTMAGDMTLYPDGTLELMESSQS